MPHDDVESLELVRRKRKALDMRLRKVPYREIADELGVSPATVVHWVREATVTYLPSDEADTLRVQEVAGIDEHERRAEWAVSMLARRAEERAEEHESYAYELEQIKSWQEHVGKLRQQRALLLGLNVAPVVKHNITIKTEFDAEVEELTALLAGGGNLMSTPEDIEIGEDMEASA